MKLRILATSSLVLLLALISFAQTYQTGKIVSVTRREATVPNKNKSDQPTSTATDDYDVVISVGGTEYTALYKHHGDLEPAWSAGKNVDVMVSGKTLSVKKANGKPEKLAIVSSKPAA